MTTSIQTKVVHSETKSAWNIVATEWGRRYKIARIPYIILESENSQLLNTIAKSEALERAEYISYCLNNINRIKP